jgi:hypothetical protein
MLSLMGGGGWFSHCPIDYNSAQAVHQQSDVDLIRAEYMHIFG